jgi:Tol biopolymer transport system component
LVGGEDKLAIMPLEGGASEKQFHLTAQFLCWTPDSRAILYVKNEGRVSNIWSQPVSGGSATQVTRFNSDLIHSFDLSRDGKYLVMNRGIANRDVVLIRDVQ